MSSPTFSKEFYTSSWMFNKDVSAVKAEDGRTVIQAGLLVNPLKLRHTHVAIDANGTITTVPFSIFDNVKRYFTFTQDPNLIAVHQRLKQLRETRDYAVLQRIQDEVHQEGFRGAEILKSNIETLTALFDKANQKSPVTLTLLKVVNFLRKLLCLRPITFTSFVHIAHNHFNEAVINPALDLTTSDHTKCNFYTNIHNNSDLPLSEELTDTNIKRLELGLLRTLNFTIDNKQFALEYDREKKEFVLLFGEPVADNENASVAITEKKPNGKIYTHLLKCYSTASYQPGTWRNLFHEIRTFNYVPGRLPLTLGNEYKILLSEGSISLEINRLNSLLC
jgi:hypothetical protein